MRRNSFKSNFVVYFIALFFSVTSGTMLKLFCTDSETGFVNTGIFPGDTIILYIFRLSLLLPILFWFFSNAKRRTVNDYPISERYVPSTIFSAITSIFVVLYTFTGVPSQIISEKLLQEQPGIFIQTSFSNRMLLFAVMVLGVLAGLSLIISIRTPKMFDSSAPGAILGFTPALWQIVVLFARFNNFIAVTTINDILMVLLFMCFASMFLIGQSRILFGLGVTTGKTYAIPAGFSVSLIGLTFALPALISYFVNGSLTYVIYVSPAEFGYIVSLSLYAIFFTYGFSRAIKTV